MAFLQLEVQGEYGQGIGNMMLRVFKAFCRHVGVKRKSLFLDDIGSCMSYRFKLPMSLLQGRLHTLIHC